MNLVVENIRADSSRFCRFVELGAGVNYYASVSKAAQAAQAQSQKLLAWDWLQGNQDKVPMKDVVRSIRHHCKHSSKASYELTKTANEIVDQMGKNRHANAGRSMCTPQSHS